MKPEETVQSCCVTSCEVPLDQNYWNERWNKEETKWDIGFAAPAICHYIDQIENKNSAILIPGCGNAYEAEYLLNQGFTNITLIDIAPMAVENLQKKFQGVKEIKILCEDFFEHNEKYDIIIEQTFFCALPPTLRQKYVWKMHQLLNSTGKLVGLLFNRHFQHTPPPFGGTKKEYEQLFEGVFSWSDLKTTDQSIEPRMASELWIDFTKNDSVNVNFYQFEGITCSGCMNTVTEQFLQLDGVVNVQMSSDFSGLFIASERVITLNELQGIVSNVKEYRINVAN